MLINSLLKIGIISVVWIWLKPRWKPLCCVIAYILLLNILHSEYIEYVEISEESKYLGASFVAKWLLIVSGIVGYLLFHELGKTTTEGTLLAQSSSEKVLDESDDGFTFLRDKKKLDSRGDKIIERK